MKIVILGSIIFTKNVIEYLIKKRFILTVSPTKISAMKIYKSEIKKFPFLRSVKTIQSLARVRGSEIGSKAAEAFEILKKIN